MLTVTPPAAQFVKDRNQPIHLELTPCVDACCFQLQEGPSVKFGLPRNPQDYRELAIDGITVYVPFALRLTPLTVTLSSFLGYKRLVVEGWQLV